MAENNLARAGCYIRVSTENQLENYSIEEQTERLEAYCKAKDWTIVRFYTDGGFSGGNMNRPALKQLISDISLKKINMVAVYKLDRLSRSQKDTLTLIEDEFLVNNVDFVSVSENFDTSTAFGKAMIGILSVFAQLEKDQITERFTMGRIGRGKAGYYHGGPTPPTGYEYIDGLLVLDNLKAAQVREVFGRFLAGYSINSIQRYMSEKYGGWKSHTLIINILRNSAYIGKVKFKGTEYKGLHEPITSEEVFYRVQELLTSSKREDSKSSAQKTPFRAEYVLSSLIYCKRCGARYSANHGYYKCYSRSKSDKKYIKDPLCKNKNWKIGDLEQGVIDELEKLKYSSGYLDNLFEDCSLEGPDSNDVSKKINDIDTQISKLLDLYQIDNAPFSQITSRITTLQDEREKLTGVLNSNQSKETHTKKDFIERLKSFEQIFLSEGTEEKRMFVSYFIKSIEIDGDNVQIQWRI